MTDFTIANAFERLKDEGDIFKPVLARGIDLEKILKRVDREKMNELFISKNKRTPERHPRKSSK